METERNYVEALNMIMTVSLSKQLLSFWDENLEIVVGSNLGDNPVAKKNLTNYETISSLSYF